MSSMFSNGKKGASVEFARFNAQLGLFVTDGSEGEPNVIAIPSEDGKKVRYQHRHTEIEGIVTSVKFALDKDPKGADKPVGRVRFKNPNGGADVIVTFNLAVSACVKMLGALNGANLAETLRLKGELFPAGTTSMNGKAMDKPFENDVTTISVFNADGYVKPIYPTTDGKLPKPVMVKVGAREVPDPSARDAVAKELCAILGAKCNDIHWAGTKSQSQSHDDDTPPSSAYEEEANREPA